MVDFKLLASSTTLYVVFDECSHTWPPIESSNVDVGGQFSRMSCRDWVMELFYDLSAKVVVFRNVLSSLIEQHGFPV